MKKIVPFEKEIPFKTQLSEITSISLEHTLHIDRQEVVGDFIISGDYRLTDTSVNTENFRYDLPLSIDISEDYTTDKAVVDVDDFYYEIMNNNALVIHIDVKVDHLEEKPLYVKEEETKVTEENKEERESIEAVIESAEGTDPVVPVEPKVEEHTPVTKVERDLDTTKEMKSLFANLEEDAETFITYKICIVREADTIESIQEKYSITREELEKYNNLSELKIGDKLIIPTLLHAQD